jgi:hypothetical protein
MMVVIRRTAPDVDPAEEDGDESVSRQKTHFPFLQDRDTYSISTPKLSRVCLFA